MNIVVVGGAGFIGCNTANYFANKKHTVTVLDNFSRKGTRDNEKWLKGLHPDIEVVEADIVTDSDIMVKTFKDADVVIHLAAQVAVTTSVEDPKTDFEINAVGTFNLLEAVRAAGSDPIVIYSSTNKVYGGMEDVEIVERDGKYQYKDLTNGASEDRQLDFHSPYGCSKGAADQYCVDYARIYGLKTVVFRQSCIYGTRQFGVEDQGWVAWFTIAAVLDKQITLFGDGKQVRDVLFVEDLIEAYEAAIKNIDVAKGKAYNMGGGPDNQMSLLELLAYLEEFLGKKIPVQHDEWRPGDQKVFVADISKVKKELGWEPKTSIKQGVKILSDWVNKNEAPFK